MMGCAVFLCYLSAIFAAVIDRDEIFENFRTACAGNDVQNLKDTLTHVMDIADDDALYDPDNVEAVELVRHCLYLNAKIIKKSMFEVLVSSETILDLDSKNRAEVLSRSACPMCPVLIEKDSLENLIVLDYLREGEVRDTELKQYIIDHPKVFNKPLATTKINLVRSAIMNDLNPKFIAEYIRFLWSLTPRDNTVSQIIQDAFENEKSEGAILRSVAVNLKARKPGVVDKETLDVVLSHPEVKASSAPEPKSDGKAVRASKIAKSAELLPEYVVVDGKFVKSPEPSKAVDIPVGDVEQPLDNDEMQALLDKELESENFGSTIDILYKRYGGKSERDVVAEKLHVVCDVGAKAVPDVRKLIMHLMSQHPNDINLAQRDFECLRFAIDDGNLGLVHFLKLAIREQYRIKLLNAKGSARNLMGGVQESLFKKLDLVMNAYFKEKGTTREKVEWKIANFIRNVRPLCSPEEARAKYSFDFTLHLRNSGTSGIVFDALVKGDRRNLVAIKVMDLEMQPDLDRVLDEVKIMKRVGHPNVISLKDVFLVDNKVLWIVMDRMENDLFATLDATKTSKKTQNQTAYLAREVLKGLVHLHECGIIHRDLKPENIMWDYEGHIKIIDFGQAKSDDSSYFRKSYRLSRMGPSGTAGVTKHAPTNRRPRANTRGVGTEGFVAIEILEDGGEYTEVADIYSLGIVLYEFYYGHPPWDLEDPNILETMYHLNIKWDSKSELLNDFIKRCLEPRPLFRPTANQLLGHDLIKSIENVDVDFNSALPARENLPEFRESVFHPTIGRGSQFQRPSSLRGPTPTSSLTEDPLSLSVLFGSPSTKDPLSLSGMFGPSSNTLGQQGTVTEAELDAMLADFGQTPPNTANTLPNPRASTRHYAAPKNPSFRPLPDPRASVRLSAGTEALLNGLGQNSQAKQKVTTETTKAKDAFDDLFDELGEFM